MKRLRIALAVSVLLNLFLLGALAGGAAWVRGRNPMIAAGSLRIAGAELPDDQRRAFRRVLRSTRAEMRTEIEASRAARREAAATIRQRSPDRAAAAGALARAREADFRVREAVEGQALDFTLRLPQRERTRVADAMTRRADGSRGQAAAR